MTNDREKHLAGIYDNLAKFSWSELSEPERAFVAVWELEAEVNNGGFSQYFFNAFEISATDSSVMSLAMRPTLFMRSE